MSQLKVDSIVPRGGVPSGGGGGFIQTKSSVKTDTFSHNTSTFTDITGLNVSITPTSTSSKVLVICQISGNGAAATQGYFSLTRVIGGSTDNTIFIGDANSNRVRAPLNMYNNQNNECKNGTLVFLDSPSTTSAITYKIQCRNQGQGTVFVNRSELFQNNANSGTLTSSITAMEVSG